MFRTSALSSKSMHPSSSVKHGDISPYIRQNCDATSRVLTQRVIIELQSHVPESQGTQLYLLAVVWTHAPYRDDKFGPPPAIVRSLWAGLMTWRRWRQYIVLVPSLSLTANFISRPHYLTEEVLVHAGINHMICMYLCFPHCDLSDYGLRHTGNRGLEAIHGMFRGGTTSLPITSPNLSFREFLEKMNTAQQIHRAEHSLRQTEGSTIVASKKKRKTFAAQSSESGAEGETSYRLPSTYETFIAELDEACKQGDLDSRKAIETLAPHMAATLKREEGGKPWECPDVPLEEVPSQLCIATSLSQIKPTDMGYIPEPILNKLGPLPSADEVTITSHTKEVEKSNQAIANLLLDIDVATTKASTVSTHSFARGEVADCQGGAMKVTTLLKGLQPQREVPSKDRGR